MKLGIVSTHRAWTAESRAWADYHLAQGFDRIYLFLDDGDAGSVPHPAGVHATLCTHAYWHERPMRPGHADYFRDVLGDLAGPRHGTPERVMQRQVLNVCSALELAADEGMDWLLHIDDDEYFWSAENTVREHFGGLQAGGIAHALYWNHEAILLEDDQPDGAVAHGTFKKHPSLLTEAQRAEFEAMLHGKPYFVAHCSGKSACRVRPGIGAGDVHLYRQDRGTGGEALLASPAILHRPYRSVRQFCDKHVSMGVFPTDRVLGRDWVPPGVVSAAERLCRAGDLDGLRDLYRRAVLWTQAEFNEARARDYLINAPAPWHAAGA